MKNPKLHSIITPLLLAGASSLSAQYFTQDFEAETQGTQPTATAIRPTSNDVDNFIEVVSGGDNFAGGGSGNGIRVLDNSTSSFTYENNFVAGSGSQLSSLHLSFDLAWNQTANTDGDYARFGVTAYDPSTGAVVNQSSNNFFEIRLGNDGSILAAGGGSNASTNLVDDSASSINVFINDSDSSSINYSAPSGGGSIALSANSFAVYVNNTLLLTDTMENGALTGDNNLGRYGVVSFGAFTGIDYTFDNFNVSAIPEPSTYATLTGLLTAACTMMIRRRKF